ncbi:hypothetical protein GWK47_018124 [Chionoecetes opilio]|uniref:Uncharacterized protein n=1 Tax=Chionoecetes opilio TaxID=41210 RepID=A0A8J5CIS5_CHIOP|nr:hypothetical protein GWK47_018124 [Chionoecetes opilio]
MGGVLFPHGLTLGRDARLVTAGASSTGCCSRAHIGWRHHGWASQHGIAATPRRKPRVPAGVGLASLWGPVRHPPHPPGAGWGDRSRASSFSFVWDASSSRVWRVSSFLVQGLGAVDRADPRLVSSAVVGPRNQRSS